MDSNRTTKRAAKLLPFVHLSAALFAMCAAAIIILTCDSFDLNNHPFINSFVDSRDGQSYRTVLMPDNRTWMAENLNYQTDSASWCYSNATTNCALYGRLYTWAEARSACPEGWRLPSQAEWQALFDALGGANTAGTQLRSQTGWSHLLNGYIPGTDEFGFSALGGGQGSGNNFNSLGMLGIWWANTEALNGYYVWVGDQQVLSYRSEVRLVNMGFSRANVAMEWTTDRNRGISVRCVMD